MSGSRLALRRGSSPSLSAEDDTVVLERKDCVCFEGAIRGLPSTGEVSGGANMVGRMEAESRTIAEGEGLGLIKLPLKGVWSSLSLSLLLPSSLLLIPSPLSIGWIELSVVWIEASCWRAELKEEMGIAGREADKGCLLCIAPRDGTEEERV